MLELLQSALQVLLVPPVGLFQRTGNQVNPSEKWSSGLGLSVRLHSLNFPEYMILYCIFHIQLLIQAVLGNFQKAQVAIVTDVDKHRKSHSEPLTIK